MDHTFKGGDQVTATEKIVHETGVPYKPFIVLAEKGDLLVVRSASPLEVTNYKNLLLAFAVKPEQIEVFKGVKK